MFLIKPPPHWFLKGTLYVLYTSNKSQNAPQNESKKLTISVSCEQGTISLFQKELTDGPYTTLLLNLQFHVTAYMARDFVWTRLYQ